MMLRRHRRRRRLRSIHNALTAWMEKNEKTRIYTPVYYIYTILKKCGTRTHKNKNSLHVLFSKLVRRENCLFSFIIFYFTFSISVIVVLCLLHPPLPAFVFTGFASHDGRMNRRTDGRTDG